MDLVFKNLQFFIAEDKRIYLTKCGNIVRGAGGFVEVQICGENKDSHLGVKMANSSEGARLFYVSHTQTENTLTIVQQSEKIQTTTVFETYDDTNAIRVHTEVKNISDEDIILEEVSAFVAYGIGEKGIDSADDLYYTRFLQSHHAECQPRKRSFRDWGLFRANVQSQKRISFSNVGSWSTKEELPQGIIEEKQSGAMMMFQIESNSSWYYEIADKAEKYYLYLGAANLPFGGWSKKLLPMESYSSIYVALSFGNNLNETVGEMTKYRRHIAGRCAADENLPSIFNEYMHLSWDSPSEETTKKYVPAVAKTGVEYYVIDCGWHNEEPGNAIYPFVGQWKESHARFPKGIRETTDFIRAHGMKAGLWIEPEIIGIKCQDMLTHYDDDCFFQRNGKRLAVMNRHFLDYRNEKVREYMTETIRRMVEDYGADYIKCDYNQDCGVGTDVHAMSAGEGLQESANAFIAWIEEMMQRFPNVIFEGCSSGGMRMDYKTLSAYSLISTSDQIDYLQYPYIAGNVLAAVLPEQAAVWSYPVGSDIKAADVSQERIVVNMINSFLGRMHLASHLDEMNETQLSLVSEGVEYYKTLSGIKKVATPYFPNGFTGFGADNVTAGLKTENKIYLAVWCLKGEKNVSVKIPEGIKNAKIAYPTKCKTELHVANNEIALIFEQDKSAVFLEIEY